MKWVIKAEIRGRIRAHADISRMTLAQADVLEHTLRSVDGVRRVKVYDLTRDMVIEYGCDRERVIKALAAFAFTEENAALVPVHTGRASAREFQNRLIWMLFRRYAARMLIPHTLRVINTVCHAVQYAREGALALVRGELSVAVLDAAAIVTSLVRDDHDTASSIMFLLGVGELLEDWVRKKSIADLAGMMSLNVDKVWRITSSTEELVSVADVYEGDTLIVRTGHMIPLDGKVIAGEAMVNQASMTGESMPVRKPAGSVVFGGTVVEEGECRFIVEKASGSGRYDRIVRMIEDSEKLKSQTEARAASLADRLVPYSFAGTLIAYALTRNSRTASSFLMVDYSCALKLTMPLAVLSAMREGSQRNISIKGGKYLEAMAQADTIVFDKTGTLTYADPAVVIVIPFAGQDESEMLRLAACLEEHYPHSIANAVVSAAKERGLHHEERHTTVEYVVAHGITSQIDGQRASIGSYHFIFEDEGVNVREEDQPLLDALPGEYSLLYLALDGTLAAVLCIEDPLRRNVPAVISELRAEGFDNIVMMTGDSEKTAACIARQAGVDHFIAEVLPEDKAAFIRKQKDEGRKVVMIGDGVNDSPALSEADVGIAVSTGAAIAREISDITIESEDLGTILELRELSQTLMRRIHRDYRVIIAFNSMLIALGLAGVLPPAASAMAHNISTLLISMYNMTNLLEEKHEES